MWAFAIWDHKKRKLLLSRDIFGENHFTLLEKKKEFILTEIKYLKSLSKRNFEFNYEYINNFAIYGYRILNKTPDSFKDVKKLKSSHQIIIDYDLNFKESCYYSPNLVVL